MSLKTRSDAETFTFSRTWTATRAILHLAVGQLGLVNVAYLVADDDLSDADVLIGQPVLRHLQVDTRTMLENNCARLDGTDCSNVRTPRNASRQVHVGRLMIARLNHVRPFEPSKKTSLSRDRPRVNFYKARAEEDPFPDPSLLDPVDSAQHNDVRSTLDKMI